ncbi:MAG: sigma-70 family RNA polymerase sigma factor [Burkholderiales bacterium]
MAPSVQSNEFDYESALMACARGDQRELQKIYEREASRLLGVAYRILRRRDLADEAVHDAFLQIWQKAATFDPARGSGRGWIYTVVRHRALNMLRDLSRETLSDGEHFDDVADAESDPLDYLSRMSDATSLTHCLERLDEPKRTSILLAFVDGYTHQEIAARLNAPLGTVKAWIRRGLLSLKECLA